MAKVGWGGLGWELDRVELFLWKSVELALPRPRLPPAVVNGGKMPRNFHEEYD